MTENLYQVWGEERDGERITSADEWIDRVECLVGFDLDGDEARDGYSLDGAFAMFGRGMSARNAAVAIVNKKTEGKNMTTKTIYRIAYAYPTSDNADLLNDGDGCWYVQCETRREDGTWHTAPVVDAFPAASEDNEYLIQHLAEWSADT